MARDEWRASQSELNPERLVFIDETGAATDMARRYGRCPRGQRLVSSVPWGHWKTTTFVAALRVGEVAARTIEALIAAIAEAVTKVSPQDRGRAQTA